MLGIFGVYSRLGVLVIGSGSQRGSGEGSLGLSPNLQPIQVELTMPVTPGRKEAMGVGSLLIIGIDQSRWRRNAWGSSRTGFPARF